MPDETAQTEDSAQSTGSVPADMPLEATEASAREVTPSSVKDDNSVQNVPESQLSEPVYSEPTAQTGEITSVQDQKSEPIQASETPPTSPETGTDQIPPSEPIPESVQTDSAPVFSASAEPVPVPVSSKTNLARDLLNKARQVIQSRKQKKIDHIMDLFAKRTNITNDEVEKFLHVSDATATRYLEILEKENKIKQSGKTGKGVKYEKI